MAIYRDFLGTYIHIQDRKGTFHSTSVTNQRVHTFSADAFPKLPIHLVDPKTYQYRDPEDAIRQGQSIEDAVKAGIAAGIFTFSEIVFDTARTHAAFTFSFVCGGLCGRGGTIIYELKNGKWAQTKTQCGIWIS